ncbi:MAG: hypothetical protein JXA21_09310 [Anaerolineae bacterium]|nr:hypothetical protein [Anaerolineae bacterium]
MKSPHIAVFVVLIIVAAIGGCLVGALVLSQEQETTIESAGFPIYLPSSDVLQPFGIAYPPTVTLKYDRDCQYLEVCYDYKEPSPESPALMMQVSNGCAYDFYRDASPVALKWAKGGQAMHLGFDTDHPTLIFYEPVHNFQYFVASKEAMSITLTILESMN